MLAMNLIATTSVGFTRREDDDGQAAGIMTGNRRVRIRNYILMCMAVLCTSCASYKKVVYLQDVEPLKQQVIEQKYEVYIHNDDLLAIMVNSKNPELALPFNMPMISYQIGS